MKEEFTSIQDYVEIVRRRKWSLILPAILIFSVAAVGAFVWPPTYRSTSTILIEEQGIPRDFVASTVTGFADQRLQGRDVGLAEEVAVLGGEAAHGRGWGAAGEPVGGTAVQ